MYCRWDTTPCSRPASAGAKPVDSPSNLFAPPYPAPLRRVDPEIQLDRATGHREKRNFDGGKRKMGARKMLLPDLIGRVKVREIGMELLDAHDIGERRPGGAADPFRVVEEVVHLGLDARPEVRLRRVGPRCCDQSVAIDGEQARDE